MQIQVHREIVAFIFTMTLGLSAMHISAQVPVSNSYTVPAVHPELTLTVPVRCTAFSPDDKLLAAGYEDGTMKLWDAQTGRLQRTIMAHHKVNAVTFAPDGTLLASGGIDESDHGNDTEGTVKLWNTRTRKLQWSTLAHPGSIGQALAVAFSPDGKILASAGGGFYRGEVQLMDVQNGKVQRTLGPGRRGGPMPTVAFTPDGRHVVSVMHEMEDDRLVTENGQTVWGIKMWDVQTGNLWRTLRQPSEFLNSISMSPNGKAIVTGGIEAKGGAKLSQVIVKNIEDGKVLRVLSQESGTQGQRLEAGQVAFAPNGKLVGSVIGAQGRRGELKLWDADTGDLKVSLPIEDDAISAFAFSPDSNLVATGSAGGAVKIWHIKG